MPIDSGGAGDPFVLNGVDIYCAKKALRPTVSAHRHTAHRNQHRTRRRCDPPSPLRPHPSQTSPTPKPSSTPSLRRTNCLVSPRGSRRRRLQVGLRHGQNRWIRLELQDSYRRGKWRRCTASRRRATLSGIAMKDVATEVQLGAVAGHDREHGLPRPADHRRWRRHDLRSPPQRRVALVPPPRIADGT